MSHYPTYPEDYWFPPRSSHTLKYCYIAWFFLEYHLHGASRRELATRTIETWRSLPWPSERLAVAAFVLVVLWFGGGGVWRGVAGP